MSQLPRKNDLIRQADEFSRSALALGGNTQVDDRFCAHMERSIPIYKSHYKGFC